MIVTGILISITMFALGAIIKYGKQYWLIAGYNTMPKEKQKNVDIAGLTSFMGNCFFGLGLLFCQVYWSAHVGIRIYFPP